MRSRGKFHHLNLELSTVVDQLTAANLRRWEKATEKLAEMRKRLRPAPLRLSPLS